jgi:hypothetical protein
MPQPAPSSRMLRLGWESVRSNNGRCGSDVVGDVDCVEVIDAMYDDKTRPASLFITC